MITANVKRKPHRNPLRADPTKTATLRRVFMTAMRKRMYKLQADVWQLVVVEDAFGLRESRQTSAFNTSELTNNNRWKFRSDPDKVRLFQIWLQQNVDENILPPELPANTDQLFWEDFVRKGYEKGAGRAYTDVRKKGIELDPNYLAGGRDEFLRKSFAQPASINKVKLLVGRVYSDLKGVTQAMSTQMTRVLSEGFAEGVGPREVGRRLNKTVKNIGRHRAVTIARTETIRAHAEGQLDSLEELGVTEVGVAVEWSTAGDDRVCPMCSPLEGVIMSTREARGILPRHPNCRCAFKPANVGESKKGRLVKRVDPKTGKVKTVRVPQKRTAKAKQAAIDKSIQAEIPKRSDRTVAEQKAISTNPIGRTPAKAAPKSILDGPDIKPPTRPKPPKDKLPKDRQGFKPEFKDNSTKAERSRITKLGGERSRLNKLIKAGGNDHLKPELENVLAELKQINDLVKSRISGGGAATIEKIVPVKKPTLPPTIKVPESKIPIPTPKDIEATAVKWNEARAEVHILRAEKTKLKSAKWQADSLEELKPIEKKLHENQQKLWNANERQNEAGEQMRRVKQRDVPVLDVLKQERMQAKRKKMLKLEEEFDANLARLDKRQTELYAKKDAIHAKQEALADKWDDMSDIQKQATNILIKQYELDATAIHKELRDEVWAEAKKINNNHRKQLEKSFGIINRQKIKVNTSRAKTKYPVKFQNPEGPQTVLASSPPQNKNTREAKKFVQSISSKNSGIEEINISVHRTPTNSRAFSREGDEDWSGIFMADNAQIRTYVHEIGHQLEDQMFEMRQRATEFRNARIARAGTKDVRMVDAFPSHNYKESEIGNPDGFIEAFGDSSAHYVGKNYGQGEATEIISMGIEKLYYDPIGFARNDPEYFDFIVNALSGDL